MADVFLIVDSDLKQYSPISGNIDINKYRYLILEVQQFLIEPVLGTKLFDKIVSDFDGDTLAGVYSTIHTDYIKPILIHQVAAEYTEMNAVLVQNGGVFRRTPENSQPATMGEVSQLAAKLRTKAQVHIQRLEDYLRKNQSNISEYTYTQNNDWDIKPHKGVNTAYGIRLSTLGKNMSVDRDWFFLR